MADLTTQQLAQLLLGIARAQNAIVEALESAKAGFKGTYLRPTIESAARIKTNRSEALTDYPSRLLLQMIGRGPPDLDIVVRDLGNLLRAAPLRRRAQRLHPDQLPPATLPARSA